MNPALKSVLDNLRPAVDAAIAGAEASLPPLTVEGVTVLESVVVPKLDVPAFLLPMVKGLISKVETPVDTAGVSELELLKARLDAIL